jgi:hypothetical protein
MASAADTPDPLDGALADVMADRKVVEEEEYEEEDEEEEEEEELVFFFLLGEIISTTDTAALLEGVDDALRFRLPEVCDLRFSAFQFPAPV